MLNMAENYVNPNTETPIHLIKPSLKFCITHEKPIKINLVFVDLILHYTTFKVILSI